MERAPNGKLSTLLEVRLYQRVRISTKMTCSYCGARNGDGEHRCRRCGRRPGDRLNGEVALHRTTGALAAKLQPVAAIQSLDAQQPAVVPDLARAVQGSLFPDKPAANVIPFESLAPAAPKTTSRPRTVSTTHGGSATKQPARRAPRVPEGQGELDFLPVAPTRPRTLGTTVEAVIYCEAPVATPLHRAVAAALDWSMVLIAYGLFLLTFRLCGGDFVLNRSNLTIFALALPLVGFAYGIFWTIAGTETAGMRWTHLRLTTFDGFTPDGMQRLLRFAGSCLSLCTMLGMLWSLADEESLTWQDHISRTFPTPHELESRVFQRC